MGVSAGFCCSWQEDRRRQRRISAGYEGRRTVSSVTDWELYHSSFRKKHRAPQFHDVQRTVGPVVGPADDYVAVFHAMQVFQEIAALVFEFNADALPAVGLDLAHGFAVGELRLDLRDHEA